MTVASRLFLRAVPLAGAAAAAASAPAALAQTAGVLPPGIVVTASIDVSHDSNVRRFGGSPYLTGSAADERATPSIGVTINKSLGRNSLTLDATAGYDFYRRNTQLNRERLGFGADLGLVGGPCVVHLRPTFSRQQSDLSEYIPIENGGRASLNNTQQTQSYAGEVQCGDRYGLRPLILGTHAVGTNSLPQRQISDYRTNTYGAGVAYGDPIYGEFALRATRSDTDYPHRPASFGNGTFSMRNISLDFDRSIGARLSGSVGVSYIMVRPSDPVVRDSNNFGWHVDLTATPTPDLQVAIGTSRNVTPSLGNDSVYQINRSYRLNGSYAFNSRFQFSLAGSISRTRYAGSIGYYGPIMSDATLHMLTGTLTLKASNRLNYSLYGGYQDRNTNRSIYNYHSYFVGLRAALIL